MLPTKAEEQSVLFDRFSLRHSTARRLRAIFSVVLLMQCAPTGARADITPLLYFNYANAVAVSGPTFVAGYEGFEVATVSRWNNGQLSQWNLSAPDGANGDWFGASVAVSGDVVVVGAPEHNSHHGAAYVFRWNGNAWVMEYKIFNPSGDNPYRLGIAVAVQGDKIAVGEPNGPAYVGPVAGHTFFYRYNGTTWVSAGGSPGATSPAWDGHAVAISPDSNFEVDGAPVATPGGNYDVGQAYLRQWNGTTYSSIGTLAPSDPATYTRFGWSVGASGSVVVVGAPFDDLHQANNSDYGSAYVFRVTPSSWTQQQKLVAPSPLLADFFGASVSVSGDRILIGAGSGSADYLFKWNGASWALEATLAGGGRSVALDGKTAATTTGYQGYLYSLGCGDGVADPFELCDDGNNLTEACAYGQVGCTVCDATCHQVAGATSFCGDAAIDATNGETCDDGNQLSGDGCSATCTVEAGYYCTGTPSVCTLACGDGLTMPPETCDDGNTTAGDGCSATCAVETGYSCTGAPSVCFPQCSDGVDSDGDGVADFPADPGCTSPGDLSEHDPGLACDDGVDNDGDGFFDFRVDLRRDPGCTSRTDASEREPGGSNPCDDGIDNDGDGRIDYPTDPGCANAVALRENPVCNDGIDNDGDSRVDVADPDCLGDASRNTEFPIGAGGSYCGFLGIEAVPFLVGSIWLRRRRMRIRPAGGRRVDD